MSDDSAACPHLGLKDNSQQAVKSAEEERILRSMSKNAPKLSKNVLRVAYPITTTITTSLHNHDSGCHPNS
jgi:hypothetical protein